VACVGDEIDAREDRADHSAAEREAQHATCSRPQGPRLGPEARQSPPTPLESDGDSSAGERLGDVAAIEDRKLQRASPPCAGRPQALERDPPDNRSRRTHDDHDAHADTHGQSVGRTTSRREEDQGVAGFHSSYQQVLAALAAKAEQLR